jgi:type I restriction enzyme S subunit|tara:strand:+ start:3626 stop:4897 length:1272 start_codon:yes stop_codon:yes gene_type:complete
MSNQKVTIPPPELRFKKDDGSQFPDWKIVPLKSIAKRQTAKNTDEEIVRVLTNSAVGGILDQKDYFKKDIAVKGNLQGYYIVDKNDYVYNPRISTAAPVGPISKNKIGKGVMSPLYTVFSFNNENSDFYEYFFKSSKWHRYLKMTSNTGARHDRMSISAFNFINMPVPIADEIEQLKIAGCLSSLNKLLIAVNKKLEATKSYKKGLMEQLFPTEGENLPYLRFPEFKGKWENCFLGDFASFSKGKGISKSDITYDGQLPCIRYGQLYTDYGETIDKVISSTNIPSSDLVLSEKNDVIIPASGETHEDIATASCLKHSGIALGSDLNIIRSNCNGVFLSYYLNGTKKNDIARLAQGVSVVHLYSSQLKTLELSLPEYREQQKIAECLSSIDILITEQEKLINSLKSHKDGLLQQLFPELDKVSV